MTALPSLLGALMAIVEAHPLCQRATVTQTREFAADQYYLRIRVRLPASYNLQIRLYHNRGHVDYSYQLFAEVPLLRWDNKEEFRSLPTYPHHHHDPYGRVSSSPLTGNPLDDIHTVLKEIEQFLASRQSS